MVLPVILGTAAVISGAIGIGTGARGMKKIKTANQRVKTAAALHEENIQQFKAENDKAIMAVRTLGEKELEIISETEEFFSEVKKAGIVYDQESIDTDDSKIRELLPDELNKPSSKGTVLIGSVGGAALGTGCGIGTASAAAAAVMALGTASTGTAITQLSGAAATNAALAALGGGAITAGGGGMALGSMILGGSTLGTGLLAGGIIFNLTGSAVMNRAEAAWAQMRTAQDELALISGHLKKITGLSNEYFTSLTRVQLVYRECFARMKRTEPTDEKAALAKRTYAVIMLLYDMCGTKLLIPDGDNGKSADINEEAVRAMMDRAKNETGSET